VRLYALHRALSDLLDDLDALMAVDWVHLPPKSDQRHTENLLNRVYEMIWDLDLAVQQAAKQKPGADRGIIFAIQRFQRRLNEWRQAL